MRFHLFTLNHNNWFAALDHQNDYFYGTVLPSHRKILRFAVVGQHFQYTVLSFVMFSAPCVFTKCITIVATYFRRTGIHVFPYLDDWLGRDKSKDQVLHHIQFTQCLFNRLGLILNKVKSTLIRTLKVFIGALLDFTSSKAFLPHEQFQIIHCLYLSFTLWFRWSVPSYAGCKKIPGVPSGQD